MDESRVWTETGRSNGRGQQRRIKEGAQGGTAKAKGHVRAIMKT